MGYSRALICLAILVLFTMPSFSQVIGPGAIVVGLAPVELRVERSDSKQDPSDYLSKASDYLAKATAELVSNYIHRVFEKGVDRRVVIVSLPLASSGDGSTAPPSAEVYPFVQSMGSLGIRITSKLPH